MQVHCGLETGWRNPRGVRSSCSCETRDAMRCSLAYQTMKPSAGSDCSYEGCMLSSRHARSPQSDHNREKPWHCAGRAQIAIRNLTSPAPRSCQVTRTHSHTHANTAAHIRPRAPVGDILPPGTLKHRDDAPIRTSFSVRMSTLLITRYAATPVATPTGCR